MKLHPQLRQQVPQRRQDGYILLLLLLIIAMIIFAAAVIVPSITFEIKRDREEEMIHRGAQYARAIRAYYRKFQRYPTKIEDLESSNNLRFLRKRYKDPLTGKDFKLLYFGDVKLLGAAMGGAGIPGASPIGGAGGMNGPGGFGQSSFGQSSFGQSAFGQSSFGQSTLGQSGRFASNSGFGTSSDSSSGNNQPQAGQSGDSSQGSNGSSGSSNSTNGSSSGSSSSASTDPLTGRVIGGLIVGVASVSKDETIREFNHKRKYNEWQFVYDPATDRGGIISTPYQPLTVGFGQNPPNVNAPGSGQIGTGGIGSGSGFGVGPGNQQGGMTNPTAPNGGYSMPSPPSSPPEQ